MNHKRFIPLPDTPISHCPGKAYVIAIMSVGKSVFVGQNTWKTHTQSVWAQHAEMSVIFANKVDYRRAILRVYRIKGDGTLGMAKPCHKCQKIIEAVGIRTVYYSTNQQTMEKWKKGK